MGASSLRKSGNRFANRMAAFLIRWNDLLWTSKLGWLPVLVIFVLRFGSGEDLRSRQLGHLAQEGFRVDDEIVGSQNAVAFDTGGRYIAFIPYTRAGGRGRWQRSGLCADQRAAGAQGSGIGQGVGRRPWSGSSTRSSPVTPIGVPRFILDSMGKVRP